MRVSVFGLGYVGAVSCGCFARDGMEVIGVDLNPDKVALINDGRAPVVEDSLGEIIAEGVKARRLRATTDVDEAVLASDISVISVGTPSRANGGIGLAAMQRVCEQIGHVLASKKERHVVVVRSTVLPGTVAGVVIPTIEVASGKRHLHDFGVCFNPEFLREGTSVEDHYHPPFTLIGHCNARDARMVASLYEKVEAEVLYASFETAEMVKYVCNAFHAVKITFANEMGILAQALGVDSHQVMDLLCRDTKLNISPRYLRPGFAFGGSCLPKDLRALLYRAREADLELPLTQSILKSNRAQVDRVVDLITSLRRKKVTMFGLSFKAGTDDLRESPQVAITEALIGKGFDIRIYDSNVALARLMGANKEYIQKEIPHISSLLLQDLSEAVRHGDILLIGNASEEFSRLGEFNLAGKTIVDLVGIAGLAACPDVQYKGVAW
jgi:nucleotide sugar dehydrogenase